VRREPVEATLRRYARLKPAVHCSQTDANPIGQGDPKGAWQFTDYKLIQGKREKIMDALGRRDATALIKKNGALYWNSAHTVRAACTVSKRYTKKGTSPYWYAYHVQWDEFLGEANAGFFVLGCMDRDVAFAIPVSVIRSVLDALNTTGDRYWHLHLTEGQDDSVSLTLPKTKSSLPLASYLLQLGSRQSAPA
jgi:hypothetical protein